MMQSSCNFDRFMGYAETKGGGAYDTGWIYKTT